MNSLTLFDRTFAQAADDLQSTLNELDIAPAASAVRDARRIFFTGSGSSMPPAMLAAHILCSSGEFCAQFVPTSTLLSMRSLNARDVVILVSQGWNRADAYLVSRHILSTPAKLLVVTGRPEHAPHYSTPTNVPVVIPVYPRVEKLFCRPSSPLSSVGVLGKLVAAVQQSTLDVEGLRGAWNRGISELSPDFPTSHIVVLATQELCAAGYAIALALREGAGIHAEFHEAEAYGHGWYVTDQYAAKRNRDDRVYLCLSQASPSASEGIDRLEGLLVSGATRVIRWHCQQGAWAGHCELVGRSLALVSRLNHQSGFDMNNPPGMEANRPFHNGLDI